MGNEAQYETVDDVLREMTASIGDFPDSTEEPWSRRERIAFKLTGKVSPRIFAARMGQLAESDARTQGFRLRLRLAEARANEARCPCGDPSPDGAAPCTPERPCPYGEGHDAGRWAS